MLQDMSTAPAHGLGIVGRSPVGHTRTFQFEHRSASRDAAYRRLATVLLGLDVASLSRELRAARLGLSLARAA